MVELSATVHSPEKITSKADRFLSLDVARGLAVLGMIYVHLVPTEGALTIIERAGAGVGHLIEGKTAALFCLLAGMTQALRERRACHSALLFRSTARRSATLLAVGVLFHWLVWPTEILIPMAVMIFVTAIISRLGTRALITAIISLVAVTPILLGQFSERFVFDWTTRDTHVGESALGWATCRYLLVNGNYPLLPWLVFPLVGALWTNVDWRQGNQARRWFWCGLMTCIAFQILTRWAGAHKNGLGHFGPWLISTWTPTSLPFLFLTGSAAITTVAGLSWCESSIGFSQKVTALTLLGRASLSHYVLHICLVIVPLRWVFPAEDWSFAIGFSAMLIYVSVALLLSSIWFRHNSRGPLEKMWSLISGG